MSFLEFQTLGRLINSANPFDQSDTGEIHRQIVRLRDLMEAGGARDLASCLDAAALLVDSMPHRDDIAPAEFLGTVARLIATVQSNFAIPRVTEPAPLSDDAVRDGPRAPAPVEELGVPDINLHLMNEMLLGEVLLNLGAIDEMQLTDALSAQREGGGRLGEVLLERGVVDRGTIDIAVRLQDQLRAVEPSPEEKRLTGEVPARSAPGSAPPLTAVPPASRRGLEMVSDSMLGQVLLRLGAITREQLEEGLKVQRAAGLRIGEALVEIGAVTWPTVQLAVQQQRGRAA